MGDYKKIKPVEFGESFEPADRGWITKERSASGHVGDPRKAGAEKGEKLFKAFTDDAVTFHIVDYGLEIWNGSSEAFTKLIEDDKAVFLPHPSPRWAQYLEGSEVVTEGPGGVKAERFPELDRKKIP